MGFPGSTGFGFPLFPPETGLRARVKQHCRNLDLVFDHSLAPSPRSLEGLDPPRSPAEQGGLGLMIGRPKRKKRIKRGLGIRTFS